jgi:hypothetical protein
MFSCQKQYLTRPRYCFYHLNIKSISHRNRLRAGHQFQGKGGGGAAGNEKLDANILLPPPEDNTISSENMESLDCWKCHFQRF